MLIISLTNKVVQGDPARKRLECQCPVVKGLAIVGWDGWDDVISSCFAIILALLEWYNIVAIDRLVRLVPMLVDGGCF